MSADPISVRPAKNSRRDAIAPKLQRQTSSIRRMEDHAGPSENHKRSNQFATLWLQDLKFLLDYHIHQFARYNDFLYYLLAIERCMDFLVGQGTFEHQGFRAIRRNRHAAAKLAIDLDGIFDL